MATHEGSEDSHTTGRREEVPPNATRPEKGKVPYNWDKGKGKQLVPYICGDSHLTRECPKREVPNALIRKSEEDEGTSRLDADVKRPPIHVQG